MSGTPRLAAEEGQPSNAKSWRSLALWAPPLLARLRLALRDRWALSSSHDFLRQRQAPVD